ncbi:hypothetical protein Q2941_29425 [Bradyrhizobium sp. UFLA05-153]
MGLALAASTGVMLGGIGTHRVSASEYGVDEAKETTITLADRVAAFAAELAQVKAENAKLRESQSDTSEELSRIRASLANAEIGLGALRTTIDENEAHGRDTAARIASNLTELKDEMGSLRASAANSEIGVDALRATTDKISQQIKQTENLRDVTGAIGALRH